MSFVKLKMIAWAKRTSACVCLIAPLLFSGAYAQTADLVSQKAFRVCADPANYPMSDKEGSGFENQIAELFAEKLDLPLSYEWFPMATGFIRQTLRAKKCDVVIGYAQGHEMVLNTNHYLVSSYTIIVPKGSDLTKVDTLGDPALKGKKIGVIAGSPPASHMARNGLLAGARPYQLFVDRRIDSPANNMLNDLKAGTIDAALLWGPLGGPLVKSDYPEFTVTPLLKETLPPRMFFRITMGVRQGESIWKRKLNSLIRRNQKDIDAILLNAGVPLITDMGTEVKKVAQ